ncbi:bifunctional lysylphosphatidylglycerol flippase/synthetase MprF [Thauera linaloolentis]|nr:bifunctional lysylphosphatidylglycerol flippase/synthetase MprF [Thauera linaloolentis]MCM8565381.1 bifunctional lysylphosphatidylglycerol flippase/synthetase MprF [Thauera linaloolentis]
MKVDKPHTQAGRLTDWVQRLRPVAIPALAVAILILAWTAISHLASEVSYADVEAALAATPAGALAIALACAGLSFAALVVYDLGALDFIGRKVPRGAVALTSFCAYAVGNTVGFGPLTAGAIRYRFYTPYGLEPDQVARVVAFVTVAFGLGLAGTTALGLLIAAGELSMLPLPALTLQILGAGVLAFLAGLCITAGRGRTFRMFRLTLRLPSGRRMLHQFVATLVDIGASASVLWILLPPDSIALPAFIAIYAVAVGLGVISHVPAGLGVFETVIVSTLSSHLPIDRILAALVLYRVIYHLVPLVLAVLLITGLELRKAARTPLMDALLKSGHRLAPPMIGGFTLVLGALLVFSGVTPAGSHALEALGAKIPLPVLESAHFLGSVLGMALLVVARGLVYRLDGAWWLAVIIVPISAVLALFKALAIGEVLLLATLFLALLASRRAFSRHASLLHQAMTPGWLAAMAVLLVTAAALLLFMYKDVNYTHALWWQFEFSSEAPRSLRALVGIVLVAGFVAWWSLIRPVNTPSALPDGNELEHALRIASAQARADAGLVAMGDKYLLFSADGRAFIMYGRQGRSWVALSDPIGPRECWPELVWRFAEMARHAGGRAVFYQVAPESLGLYADAGLMAFKLGEEARVHLPSFDLKGGKRANLRQALNRAERESLRFEIVAPDALSDCMDELAAVSDAWMAHHKVREKRFSLGAFDPAYVRRQPVAVLRREGRIIAFASLLLTGLKEEASIDLMRFAPDAPNGTMEVLLLRLLMYFQDTGYKCFSLGMAPLSGLSPSTAAPIWHRVGRAVFEHGERFYNFSGLRAFKAKFQPDWQARYLAVAGGINPMLALADITVLISGGLKGVIGK